MLGLVCRAPGLGRGSKQMAKRIVVYVVAVLATLWVTSIDGEAQVTIWPPQSRVGVNERYTLSVPLAGPVATESVELEIPASVTVTGILAPVGYRYRTVREFGRITRIAWTQEIKSGDQVVFVFYARNPRATEIRWRTHHWFVDGTANHWVGDSGDSYPAAIVRLIP